MAGSFLPAGGAGFLIGESRSPFMVEIPPHYFLAGSSRLADAFLKKLTVFAALIFLPSLGAAPVEQAEVVVKPVHVTYRTFDRAHPPAEMPPIKSNEAALCYYQFGCRVECQTESKRALLKLKLARITKVKMTISLDVTVWLPEKNTEKLRAHEEGHREICEAIYRRASALARKWGAKAIGLTLQHSLKDEAAVVAEVKKLQQDLMDAYMKETAASCDRAQTYFDSITAHGTNSLPEKIAIERALAQETAGLHVNTYD